VFQSTTIICGHAVGTVGHAVGSAGHAVGMTLRDFNKHSIQQSNNQTIKQLNNSLFSCN